jgi:hypothetical protein
MKFNNTNIIQVPVFLLALWLSACGGSGSTNNVTGPTVIPPLLMLSANNGTTGYELFRTEGQTRLENAK